jgi:hypothetical protein
MIQCQKLLIVSLLLVASTAVDWSRPISVPSDDLGNHEPRNSNKSIVIPVAPVDAKDILDDAHREGMIVVANMVTAGEGTGRAQDPEH